MTDTQPTFAQMIQMLESLDETQLAGVLPARLTTDDLIAKFPELADVEVRDEPIEGPHGAVPARSYRVPGRAARSALVWAHGGGFVAGDLNMAEAHWVALMIAARGIPVLSIDYRKCLRGVKFPVPSDDIVAAWQWATANASVLGTTPERLHLGGASAGANLTAGVTKRLRDGEGQLPRSVILIYPSVHRDLPALSDELAALIAETPSIFTHEAVREINLHFAGSEEALDGPYAFAANGDLAGQPPIYILNSDADTLHASGEAYAAALQNAGVEVAVEYEPGTVHGHLNEPELPGGARSIDKMISWIDRHS